jgi:hypothetical protein
MDFRCDPIELQVQMSYLFVLLAGTIMVAIWHIHDMDFRRGFYRTTGSEIKFVILLTGTIMVAMGLSP